MRMTPLEIQSQRFGRRLRGFDREEVEAFLRMLSDDYESVLKENESQRDRIRHLEGRLEEFSAQEQLLKETLVNAQSMSEKMREVTGKECEMRVGEAEVRAEKIVDASHRRAARLAQNIREMRGLRTQLAETLRSAVETHLSLIESLDRDPEEDSLVDGMVDGKITYLAASLSGQTRRGEAPEERESQAELGGRS